MGYVKMECPSCGGTVEYFGDKESFFCEFCGTRIVKDKQFIELSGVVSVSGIASSNALLERAFLFLEDQDYRSADDYLEKVLDADPKCAKAYIGKLMCQLHVREPNALTEIDVPLTKYAFYNKALRFASSAEHQQYQAYNQVILNRISAAKEAKITEIAALRQRVEELESYIENNKKQNLKNKAKMLLWKILLIISICCVVFWTIGTIAEFMMIIFNIPFIIWMVFMIRLYTQAKKSIQEYESIKIDLANTMIALSEKEISYNYWLQYVSV